MSGKAKIIIAVLVLLAGGAVAWQIKRGNDDTERAKQEAAQAEADAKKEEEQRETAKVDRLIRQSLIDELKESVTKDARSMVADGLLDGPIKRTSCSNISGGNPHNKQNRGEYECLAITETEGDSYRGYTFDARVNFSSGRYTWQLAD